MPPKLEAVVFDLDGTLVDSLGDFHHAATVMLDSLGLEEISRDELKGFIGNGQELFIARCLVRAGASLTANQLATATTTFEKAYDGAKGRFTKLYPGISTLLEALRLNGVKIGLCTNRPVVRAQSILEAVGVLQFFNVIAGFETTPRPKPDPGPILYCLNEIGVEAHHALFIGDSHVDAIAAKEAHVEFAFHTGGFGTLGSEYAHMMISDFKRFEVLQLLER
ncbi:HAD family hydrolase [Maritalea porphyrae]|uniref:HAD family hydrolase n=1 Tax=Maritalea porphyrae TaxID=880732 RepID=UPI0022AE8D94|nr:HAD-IA family hydrolase [Maritalea porphyrae]MCZ4273415.1 HAD-IA family hydrolase [Maritalea porphyrae]